MWTFLIAGAAYGFAAGAQPGPLNAYLVALSLRQGFRRTLPAAFAPLLSDALIVSLTLFVLSRIPAVMIRWLHALGGIFVLYLAWEAWRTYRRFDTAQERAKLNMAQSIWKATLINLLNPNPYLGWSLVMGPLILRGWREAPRDGFAVGLGFYAALVGTTILIVWLFDFARKAGNRVSRALVAFSSLVLAAFGAYQLWLSAMAA